MGNVKIYYKSLDGGKKVSANFRVGEFTCKDGSDIVPIDAELVGVLQGVRDHFKVPVVINSAYRTPAYNLLEGDATPQEARTVLPNSTAAEIVMSGNYREWRHILRLRAAKDAHP